MNDKIAKLSRSLTEVNDIIAEQRQRAEEIERALIEECSKCGVAAKAAAPAKAAKKGSNYSHKRTGCSEKIRSLLAPVKRAA